jgi:monofunctional biosynthetic peptidoglycan transglycosylase
VSRVRQRKRRGRKLASIGGGFVLAVVSVTVLITASLRWIAPPTSSYMLQAAHKLRTSGQPGSRIRHHWAEWEKISPLVAIAVVAAEDQKFPVHKGFDIASIEEAMRQNPHRRTPRGASTISQQVAKNLFLWPGRSFLRKGLEAYFTVLIELLWPKQRILEVYLNIAQFGPRIFGVGSASRVYFHTSPSRLSLSEAALLAAVLPNPRRFDLRNPSDYVRQRAREIEQEAAKLGGPEYLKGLRPPPESRYEEGKHSIDFQSSQEHYGGKAPLAPFRHVGEVPC